MDESVSVGHRYLASPKNLIAQAQCCSYSRRKLSISGSDR